MNSIRSHSAIWVLSIVMFIFTVLSIYISFKPPEAGDISSASGLSTVLKFSVAISGVCLWFVFLRLSDMVAGIRFKESYAAIESNAMALAAYFGLRSVGAGILLGMLLG